MKTRKLRKWVKYAIFTITFLTILYVKDFFVLANIIVESLIITTILTYLMGKVVK